MRKRNVSIYIENVMEKMEKRVYESEIKSTRSDSEMISLPGIRVKAK